MLGTLNQTKPKDLREVFPNVSEDILDLLRKTLQFNPNKRMTAEEALNHEFVSKFHDPENEPSAPSPIIIPIDDDKKLSIMDYRNALYRDVIDKKKNLPNLLQAVPLLIALLQVHPQVNHLHLQQVPLLPK